jgi:hypothetical protein
MGGRRLGLLCSGSWENEENGSRFHKMVTAASTRSKHLIIVVGVVESKSQAQDRWHRWHCDASGRLTFRIPH